MECSVYDINLARIGILDRYVSLIWNEQYQDKGKLQLVTQKTPETLALLTLGGFIKIPTSKTMMYITSIEDKNGLIWAYGAEIKTLLADRVYAGTVTFGNVESTLMSIYEASRPYSFTQPAPLKGLTAKSGSQFTYDTIFDITKAVCIEANYGFRFKFDKQSRKLLFDIYDGIERDTVVFSQKVGTLFDSTRTTSNTSYKNVAYVGGEGEGSARVFVTAGNTSASDLDRKEVFVNASNIRREDLTLSQYKDLLIAKGKEKLADTKISDQIKISVNSSDFGVKYDLGDLITCVLYEYDLRFKIRITGFTYRLENNISKLELTLGTPLV